MATIACPNCGNKEEFYATQVVYAVVKVNNENEVVEDVDVDTCERDKVEGPYTCATCGTVFEGD